MSRGFVHDIDPIIGTVLGVYSLSLLFAGGVLACGRLVEVLFYEWDFYGSHPGWIPAYWLGGMSTHGLLLGAVLGTAAFCLLHRRSFLFAREMPHVLPFDITGGPMKGRVMVEPARLRTAAGLRKWLDRARAFAEMLPQK